MIIKNEISKIVNQLIYDLVSGNYEKIENDGRIGRLNKDEVYEAITSYPGKITMPPTKAFEDFDIYEVKNASKEKWTLDFDLWYDNEQSDLTLGATIERTEAGKLIISIDDIHVL
jgi:hypothetical protein